MRSRTRMAYDIATLVLPFVFMVGNARALSDQQFLDDFTGNAANDVQAYSDMSKPAFSQKATIKDSVTVLAGSPPALTALKFDWAISGGHQVKATLPFNGRWRFTNTWTTYRYPIHVDFNLEMEPTTVPAVAAFSRTATAHEPFPSIDNVIGAVGALARVGGDIDIQQGMVAAAAAPGAEPPFPPSRQDYIDGYTGTLDLDYTGATSLASVWSEVETSDFITYTYRYFAQNFTSSSADLDWILYTTSINSPVMTLSADLGPLSGPTLLETLTGGGPFELNGEAIGQLFGGEIAFFGPAFIPQQLVPVPEPPSWLILVGVGLAVLARRRMRGG